MARLVLSLFGPFEATLDGVLITTFESNKVRALLAYVTAEADRPQRREALAAMLWPGMAAAVGDEQPALRPGGFEKKHR